MSLLWVTSVISQTIEYTNQVTVAWDAVAPIEPTDVITYEVYIDSGSPVLVGETDLLEYTITFTVEGEYVVGVRTKRVVAITGDTVYSDMNWSNVNGLSTPDPFVVRYIKPIQEPEGLRLQ